MSHDDVVNIRAALNDPHDVCLRLGLDKGARKQNGGLTIACPMHDERTPSCSVTRGPDGTLRIHCFGCGWTTDALGLIAAAERLDVRTDFRRVLERSAEIAGVQLATAMYAKHRRREHPFVERLALRIDAFADDWLRWREIRPTHEDAQMMSTVKAAQIGEAFELLAEADQIEREENDLRDAEMDRLARDQRTETA